ncbi:MAG: PIN domain-containing protein [Synechococcaceae cyanobacterium]|nr:PIN domain-containing protein [Synechococcaceae cyanobacterium]
MTRRWLLDTSALLALRDDEVGAARVAALLQAAQNREGRCLVCFMSRMEVLYRIWKDEGERNARLADAQLQALPLDWVPCSDALLEEAAVIKACQTLSVADAWIAAASRQQQAVLVHKDPEFRPLLQIPQEWLG